MRPAYESHNRTIREWWYHGKIYRIGGPALESDRGKKEWWLEGEHYKDMNSYWKECIERGYVSPDSIEVLSELI